MTYILRSFSICEFAMDKNETLINTKSRIVFMTTVIGYVIIVIMLLAATI